MVIDLNCEIAALTNTMSSKSKDFAAHEPGALRGMKAKLENQTAHRRAGSMPRPGR
jgi:hypothetical protein